MSRSTPRSTSRARSRTRTAARHAGRAARVGARAGARTATVSARTAKEHPQAAASGVGVAGLAVAVLSGVVLLKVLRSRRVRRVASTSAERGAFGPGVATASRVLHLVRDHQATPARTSDGPHSDTA